MALLGRKDFAAAQWEDWRWHMRYRISTHEKLAHWVKVSSDEAKAIDSVKGRYRWSITPYYASLMDAEDPLCPIRQQAVPHFDELDNSTDSVDGNSSMVFRRTNRVVHRYPDRVMLLMTESCPVYCRHCQRKYHTTDPSGTFFETNEGASFDEDMDYIRRTPQIRDVLLSGGDPLVYPDSKIEQVIAQLREIPHVKIIRIGSRFPVLLPQRITTQLCEMLDRYQPIWFNTHFNHPRELTPEAAVACDRLLRHGIPVGNQAVLLKGINDNEQTIKDLCYGLVDMRVRPHYLYHALNAQGIGHFRTTIEEGRRLMDSLIGHVSGLAVPRYIYGSDRGKVSLERGSVVEVGEGQFTAVDYHGEKFTFYE